MKRYVVVVQAVFQQRDWLRFGCSDMERHGYSVIPVVCANIYNPGNQLESETGLVNLPEAFVPNDLSEYCDFLDQLDDDDFILMCFRISEKSAQLYIEIGKRNLPYSIPMLGVIPITYDYLHGQDSLSEKIRFFGRSQRAKMASVKRQLSLMIRLRRSYLNLPKPLMVIKAGECRNVLSDWGISLRDSLILDVESDQVQAIGSSVLSDERIISGKYAVFLDENVVYASDYAHNNTSPIATESKYYTSVCRALSHIEEHTNLETIICLHPKSTLPLERLSKLFGGRKLFMSQTPSACRDADLVIGHSSTAFSFPVLFRKPIFILTTNEIENSRLIHNVQNMASWLGKKIVNVDRHDQAYEMLSSIPDVNEVLYARYEETFLRSPGARPGPVMDVAAKAFETISA